jgi:hypothetical protein
VWPFFGQFVAHDITADRSPVTHRADADRIRNFRIPRANLEGLYGSGPVGSPYITPRTTPAKLLLSAQGSDVPRNHEGIALIGDPRNDVHLFTSHMAVAFIKLHNRLVDRLREDETAGRTPGQRGLRPAAGVSGLMGFRPSDPGAHGRLDVADRRPGAPRRAAGQAHRLPPARSADRAAHAGLGLGAGHRLRVFGQP